MTKLREQMPQDMTPGGFTPNAQRAYLRAATRVVLGHGTRARLVARSPSRRNATPEEREQMRARRRQRMELATRVSRADRLFQLLGDEGEGCGEHPFTGSDAVRHQRHHERIRSARAGDRMPDSREHLEPRFELSDLGAHDEPAVLKHGFDPSSNRLCEARLLFFQVDQLDLHDTCSIRPSARR